MTTKITSDNISASTLTSLGGPKISGIVYPGTETATDPAGGETITLNGTGFNAGFSVIVGNTTAGVTTYVSSTQVTFTAPAATAGTYALYLINTDGGTAISVPGLSYSGLPTWTTAAGSLGTSYETTSINTTVVATGDAPITYSLYSGTLPTGSTLSSGGTLSGTAPTTASTTTYSFTIAAKDAENQTTNRAFSLTINPDVVTWSSPADNTTYSVYTNSAISNVTMSATSAGSGSITYTANSLPTGLSISGANIAGTPTVAANSSSLLTATSSINSRTATRTINWVVTVANDTYFKNTTLLLNGETTNTSFISDGSTNSFGLTIQGDTKPVLFNPYQGDGYYSAYFGGSSYVDVTGTPVPLTGQFTIEAWIYTTASATQIMYSQYLASNGNRFHFSIDSNTGYKLSFAHGTAAAVWGATVVPLNQWNHVAVTRDSSNTLRLFLNGAVDGSQSSYTSSLYQGGTRIGYFNNTGSVYFNGYMSNMRVISGTAQYTSAFTPSTSPLTAISGTSFLGFQSNRFIDNSTNSYTLTLTGTPTISPNIPFTANSSYSTYGSTYFDGTGDYLTAPSNVALNLTGDFTIEFWVYPTASIVSKSIAGTTSSSMHFDSGGYFYLLNSTGQYLRATDASFLTLNTWTHVSISRSGSTLKFFRNGIDNGVAENVGSASTATFTFSGLNIGYSPHVNASSYFTGHISDFRVVKGTAVYTTTFTPPTTPLTAIANTSLLTLQYNGGANNSGIIDNSPFNNIITRNGNSSQGSFSPYSQTGWSNYFNGSTDYLDIASNTVFDFGTSDFTIECWVYSISNSNNYPTFLSSVTGWSSGASGHRFNNFNSANKFTNYLNGAGGVASGDPFMRSTNTFSFNTWYHYALTRSGNTWKMFINGSLEDTQTYSGSYNCGLGGLRVGWSTWDGANGYYTGYVSNLRIVKGTALYTSAFTSSTTPLTSISGTSLLTCQSNGFINNGLSYISVGKSGTPSVQALSPFGSVREATPTTYSYTFNGSSDYLTIADNTAFNFGTGDATVEFWFNSPGTTNSYPGIISSINYNTSGSASIRYDNTGNKNKVFMYINGGGDPVITSTSTIAYNTWAHVAIVRQGTSLKLYLNGTLDTTATISASLGWYLSYGGMRIGRGFDVDSSNAYFPGSVSNIRLVKGTAVYTSNFTPSTTPLTAISGTSLLTCQSTTFIDNSTNVFSITQSGTPFINKSNPLGYTAQTNQSYTPSTNGGSCYFDGTGDYLKVTNTSIMSWTGSSTFTVECWTYQTAYTSTSGYMNNIIGDLTPTDATALYWSVGMNASNQPGVRWFDGTVKTADSGTGLSLNIWHHVAWVVTSGVVTIFVNGVKATLTGTTTLTTPSSTVGYYITGADRATYFTGYISDLRITRSALYTSNFVPPTQTLGNYSTTYPATLLLNFTNAGIVDQHSTNVLETVGNAQLSTSVKKYNNASMSFNGSSQYLSIPNNALWALGTGDFTIEFWVYFNTFPTASWMVQLSQYVDTNNRVSIFFGNNATNENGLVFKVVTSGTVYKAVENDSASITMASLGYSTSTWYHVAITRSGSTIKGFINGTQKCTTTTSASFPTLAAPLLVGAFDTTPNLVHNGYIDDLRITKGYARYTSNFTAPTSALITK